MGELSGESAHGEGEIEAQILGRVSGLARSGQPQLPRAEEATPAPAEEAAPLVLGSPQEYSLCGEQSSTEYAGVGPADNRWWSVVLPTKGEFLASAGSWDIGRVKDITKGLTEVHRSISEYDLGRMTDRVRIYGTLDRLSQACDDYLGKEGDRGKTGRQVEALAGGVKEKLESLRGGASERAFQMAALQYEMERDAYSGMKKGEFDRKYLGDEEKRSAYSDMLTHIDRAYPDYISAMEGDPSDEEADKVRAYLQANAILGTMRGEEIGDIKKRFQTDPLMVDLMTELEGFQDRAHYTVTLNGPKTHVTHYGREGSRYAIDMRLFSGSRYYEHGKGKPDWVRRDSRNEFPMHSRMDTVHESTHMAIGETFHNPGRSFTVPLRALGEGDENHQKQAMEELKKVVHERNETSDAITRKAEEYLDHFLGKKGGKLTGCWKGWSDHLRALYQIWKQSGYAYAMQLEMDNQTNRVAVACRTFREVDDAIGQGARYLDTSMEMGTGYVDGVRDPEIQRAYERLGQAREEAEDEKKKEEDPYGRFTNSIVEYDSTINECFYICKEIGVPESDPLMGMLRAAAQDAYEYRKRYRERGEFTSVTTHKARHRLAPP